MGTKYVTEPPNLMEKLTSRKFIAAVFGGILGLLVATGVIDANTEQTLLAGALPFTYIIVEGVLDFARNK